jgi:hypothetical protein
MFLVKSDDKHRGLLFLIKILPRNFVHLATLKRGCAFDRTNGVYKKIGTRAFCFNFFTLKVNELLSKVKIKTQKRRSA